MPISIGASVAAPLIGGVLGNIFSSGDEKKAREAQQAALQQFLSINAPSIEEQQLALQGLHSAGTYNPEAEGTVNQDPSKMADIQVDPRLKMAQMNALSTLQQLGQTGLSAEDRASLGDIRRTVSGDANARDQSIIQNMQARGSAGTSGQELAMRLAESQNASNQGAQQGDRIAAMAQSKALGAIAQAGGLAGQMNSQDFGQQSAIASAQDAINNFNARNRQAVLGQNTSAANFAQQANLQTRQRIADTNANIANEQETHNKGLYQQQFNDQIMRAEGAAGQYGHQSQYDQSQAEKTRGMFSGVGNAVGSGAAAIGAYNQHQSDKDFLKGLYTKPSAPAPDTYNNPEGEDEGDGN